MRWCGEGVEDALRDIVGVERLHALVELARQRSIPSSFVDSLLRLDLASAMLGTLQLVE